MREIRILKLLFAFDFSDSDKPGERTLLALVGVKVGSEVGLRLAVLGATLFILWVSRAEAMGNGQG